MDATQDHKKHHAPKAGTKAEKKKKIKQDKRNPLTKEEARARNPKAFSFQSMEKAVKKERRKLDHDVRRSRLPMKQRTITPSTKSEKIPPVIISVVGPPGVGKTTLIHSMIKHYSRQTIIDPTGPITVVSGKTRRLTFFECKNDLNSMIDCAKISDLILLVIDGNFGFEMETFEFLNVLQVHGFPKVMGVLTHLDLIKSSKKLRRRQKELKNRFSTEVYPGAKLFYFSGLMNDRYPQLQVHNLARFISVMKFKPLKWQNSHSYMLVDRMEDITHPQKIKDDLTIDRKIIIYGYLRGTRLKSSSKIHIPGCDDFWIDDITELSDPCPLPDSAAMRRSLSTKQRQLYAPFSNVSNIALDKDATYIEIPDHKVIFTKQDNNNNNNDDQMELGEKMVKTLQDQQQGIDEKLINSKISLFSDSKTLLSDKRERRPMNFDNNIQEDLNNNEDDDSDNDKTDSIYMNRTNSSLDYSESSNDDTDSEDNDDIFTSKQISDTNQPEWFNKVKSLYKGTNKNIMDIVYGERAIALENNSDDEDDFQLLRLVKDKQKESSNDINKIDSSLYNVDEEDLIEWDKDDNILEKLRDKFSTTTWFEDVDESLINDSDDEVYGDFEDLEVNNDDNSDEEMIDNNSSENNDNKEEEEDERMKRLKEKEALKAKFNAEYDNEDDIDYLEDYKDNVNKQMELNQEEFAQDDPILKAQLLGYESGSYVRIQLSSIPCEFVENFNPKIPLIMGGLLSNEYNLGFIQARVKRHRWHKKILKTNDPIIISLGWRRFQTLPLYSLADDSMRHRMLKYTPEHMHCYGTFYGPITPPNSGFIAFQHLQNNVSTFRVALTGVVLEVDQSYQIVKKLKLTGTPFKTYKNTAFIRGMFNSELEVSKFQGAAIRTVSGIRGQIKKPLKSPGTYRATFEDKILMSDIVFLRTWYPVHPQKYYNPVTSLLDSNWRRMKTVFELRKEKEIPVPLLKDSLYKPIERHERRFNKLHIPKSLEKELPFAYKPKKIITEKKIQRPVLIGYKDPKEKEVDRLIIQLNTIKNDKIKRQQIKQKENQEKRVKKLKEEQDKIEKRAKISRKRIFKLQGIEEERAKKKRKYSHPSE